MDLATLKPAIRCISEKSHPKMTYECRYENRFRFLCQWERNGVGAHWGPRKETARKQKEKDLATGPNLDALIGEEEQTRKWKKEKERDEALRVKPPALMRS